MLYKWIYETGKNTFAFVGTEKEWEEHAKNSTLVVLIMEPANDQDLKKHAQYATSIQECPFQNHKAKLWLDAFNQHQSFLQMIDQKLKDES